MLPILMLKIRPIIADPIIDAPLIISAADKQIKIFSVKRFSVCMH